MRFVESEWKSEQRPVETVDWTGKTITLQNVPVKIHKDTNSVRVSVDDVIKAEQVQLAKEHGIEPHEIFELLLLYVKLHFYDAGYIKKTYRFNKMLFYVWKELEKSGFGESFVFDRFASARAGPVPVGLKDSMRRLHEKSIVNAKIETVPGKSSEYRLTTKGMAVSKSLWEKTPDDIKKIIVAVKEDLMVITPDDIKKRVHKEYPEYKRTYNEEEDV